MKHYKIFGGSLKHGLQKVGYSDVLVELFGIFMHSLALSPYAKNIKKVVDELVPIMGNASEINWINDILEEGNITCGYQNGSNSAFNTCVAGITLGSAGIIIHAVELALVLIILRCGRERQANKCELWVRITVILTALETLVLVGSLFIGFQEKLVAQLIANLVYKCYSCSLVSAYVSEAKEYSDLPGNHDLPKVEDTQPALTTSTEN